MARGSVTESPEPWWKPSREKLAEKRASGAATRKSATIAKPETAADRGSLNGGDHRRLRREELHRFVVQLVGPLVGRRRAKSAPAQKCLPSDASTMARASGVVVDVDERGHQRSDQVVVEEIVRRAVHGDSRHIAVVDVDADIGVAPEANHGLILGDPTRPRLPSAGAARGRGAHGPSPSAGAARGRGAHGPSPSAGAARGRGAHGPSPSAGAARGRGAHGPSPSAGAARGRVRTGQAHRPPSLHQLVGQFLKERCSGGLGGEA